MKILYAEDEEVLRELYALQIEALVSCDIVEVSSGQEAVEALKNDPSIALVLSDYRMPNGNGDMIYQYIRENQLNIPFFLISTYEPIDCPGMEKLTSDNPHNAFYAKPIKNFKDLAAQIKTILDTAVQNHIESNEETSSQENEANNHDQIPEYCKVKLPRFLRFNNSNCPIYIRLSDNKFVKLINKEDLYDTDLIEKYAKKNVDYFYISGHDFMDFVNYYKGILESSIKRSEQNDISQVIDTHLASVSFIHEMVENVGITPQVVEIVNQTVSSTVAFVKKNKDILQYLDIILKRQSFLFEHSLMTAYLATSIAKEMDWMTDATLEKLCVTALLHDVTLNDAISVPIEEVLDNIHDGLSRKERDMIFNHPISASALLKGKEGFPPDVDWIILNHHERPDGCGYPRGLKADQIPPLACVFILAEVFSRRLYTKTANPESIELFAKELASQYDKGNFKKALEGLLNVIKKSAKK